MLTILLRAAEGARVTLTPDQMRASASDLFLSAKRFYAGSLITKGGAFLAGLITAFTGLSWWIPIFLLSLATAADALQMASETRKGKAEDFTRRVEFWDGFGWPPSERELRQMPLTRTRPDALYFASDQISGPVRAMENLEEQAWWSRELYGRMASLLLGTFFVMVIAAVLVLLIVSLSGQGITGQPGVKLVIAGLNVVLSFGLWRLYASYQKAAYTSAQVEHTADALKRKYASDSNFPELEAVRLYHGYQLARASAPLIPDTIYRLFRGELNRRWDRRTEPTPSL